uniref:AlNc14C378G11196 protein n=1 Tax=Albugo laibachii Nc14 TaxID=890382 RepID=F0WYD6_9STRA|nr:AlNc14C378G11196 [Albugo laibachii Nc14]|eukprot:CCA26489.1 AlNc14C378G11196 [Albugo laibachii Nc14]
MQRHDTSSHTSGTLSDHAERARDTYSFPPSKKDNINDWCASFELTALAAFKDYQSIENSLLEIATMGISEKRVDTSVKNSWDERMRHIKKLLSSNILLVTLADTGAKDLNQRLSTVPGSHDARRAHIHNAPHLLKLFEKSLNSLYEHVFKIVQRHATLRFEIHHAAKLLLSRGKGEKDHGSVSKQQQ